MTYSAKRVMYWLTTEHGRREISAARAAGGRMRGQSAAWAGIGLWALSAGMACCQSAPVPPSPGSIPSAPDSAVPAPPPPPLGRKLQELLVLRAVLAIRLTGADIDAVLPILRELLAAEQTLQTRSDAILDAERRALLAAGPNDASPPDSGAQIARESAQFRERQTRLWAEAARRIGEEKAGALRGIADAPRPPGPRSPGPHPPEGPPRPPGEQGGPTPGKKEKGRGPGLEPHLPLRELVALLEQKRAAMPR